MRFVGIMIARTSPAFPAYDLAGAKNQKYFFTSWASEEKKMTTTPG
jgi:hypothetical protein